MRILRQATRGAGSTIVACRSNLPVEASHRNNMARRCNFVKRVELQGFPLARLWRFPYNPRDFCILRGVPQESHWRIPNGQPKPGHHPGGRNVIMRRHLSGLAILFAALFLATLNARPAGAQQAAQGNAAPSYSLPEYNALQAAQAEKDPAAQIKLLDAFVAQYPNSTLLQYIYQLYYQAYYKQKNFAKAIEYCDKLIALGDKADAPIRATAVQARVQ